MKSTLAALPSPWKNCIPHPQAVSRQPARRGGWRTASPSRAAAVACALLAGPCLALELQGHRGARGLAPENTLVGFATALGIGVDTLELDVGSTRDGHVVVSHDPALHPDIARDPRGEWVSEPLPWLRSLSLAELARYDVGRLRPGSRTAGRFPEQRASDGAAMPTLAAVLALAARAGNERVRFNVETKTSPLHPGRTVAPEVLAEQVISVLREHGMLERSTLQSFDWRSLRHARRVAPELPTVCLSAEQRWLDNIARGASGPSPWTAGLDVDDFGGSVPRLVRAAGCSVWSPFHRELDDGALAEARGLGLGVVVWTVNEPQVMHGLIDLGVDGIITDYPDRLRAVMAKRGLPLPVPTPVDVER